MEMVMTLLGLLTKLNAGTYLAFRLERHPLSWEIRGYSRRLMFSGFGVCIKVCKMTHLGL